MKEPPRIISKRPMLMLTGFLGAGKTTLLRGMIRELAGKNLGVDVILNDRENAEIDREALREEAASVASLTGSCVCCEGFDELCNMILAVADSQSDLLLIELNGTADPIPLHEVFTLLESKFLLQPRWQVCVVDGRYFDTRPRFRDLEALQLETASHYYLSRTDLISEDAEQALIGRIAEINPSATRATAASLAEALQSAVQMGGRHALGEGDRSDRNVPSGRPFEEAVSLPRLDHRHHLAHEFTGCNIVFPSAVEAEAVGRWLQALPRSVIRVKALVSLKSDPGCRFLYERVGIEAPPNPIPVKEVRKVPCSGLFIGPDLKPDEILRITREILHPESHFPKN